MHYLPSPHTLRQLLAGLCVALVLAASCKTAPARPAADLVLTNAEIYTINPRQPFAGAVAIKDGKIVYVGSPDSAREYIGSQTNVVDARGKFLMPGFIEGHGHIHGLGASLENLNLMKARSWQEIVALVAEAARRAKPGDWIIGRGWHQEKWEQPPAGNFLGYPYHDDLDKVSPQNPVLLTHASGHSSLVNALALSQAGITNTTPSPPGGDIVRDKQGRIVGVLEETAQNLVGKVYTEWINQQPEAAQQSRWKHSIQLAEAECLRYGVTSFQDAGSSFRQVRWMKDMADSGEFKVRHWVMVRESHAALRKEASLFPIRNAGNGFLTVNAVKVSLDGALGSYGAWLLEPYSDRAGWYGQPTFNTDSLRAIADFCWEKNIQLCVHAIGDKANRELLDLYAKTISQDTSRDHRWRVEHAQHVHPAEIPRFREWNVIAAMQSIHCTSDAPFVTKRLGRERAASGAYMWRSFLDNGVVVGNGTDVPVEDIDPFACLYAAVTRKQKNGEAFFPDQRMTREEALYSYTLANAYAAFEEKQKGSIETGKWADLVLLDRNLLTCDTDSIPATKVLMTLVGGKIRFSQLPDHP